jgi:hypothetical protein
MNQGKKGKQAFGNNAGQQGQGQQDQQQALSLVQQAFADQAWYTNVLLLANAFQLPIADTFKNRLQQNQQNIGNRLGSAFPALSGQASQITQLFSNQLNAAEGLISATLTNQTQNAANQTQNTNQNAANQTQNAGNQAQNAMMVNRMAAMTNRTANNLANQTARLANQTARVNQTVNQMNRTSQAVAGDQTQRMSNQTTRLANQETRMNQTAAQLNQTATRLANQVNRTANQMGNQAGQSGNQAGQSGNQAGQSGNQAGQSGNQAGQSGNQAGQGLEPQMNALYQSGDQIADLFNRALNFPQSTLRDGFRNQNANFLRLLSLLSNKQYGAEYVQALDQYKDQTMQLQGMISQAALANQAQGGQQ